MCLYKKRLRRNWILYLWGCQNSRGAGWDCELEIYDSQWFSSSSSQKRLRTRGAGDVVPVCGLAGFSLRTSLSFILSVKWGKKQIVPVWRQSGIKSSLLVGQSSVFYSIQGLNRLNEAHPQERREIFLTQFTDLNLIFIQKHLHRDMQNYILTKYLVSQGLVSWYTKLIIIVITELWKKNWQPEFPWL